MRELFKRIRPSLRDYYAKNAATNVMPGGKIKAPVHQAPGALNKLCLFTFKMSSLAGLTSR
jgi:hypothetical protein